MHGCRRAALLARMSQKKPAAIFKAAHRFRASTLRPLKTDHNETQRRDWPLPLPALHHHGTFTATPVLQPHGAPLPSRAGLAQERNFWKVRFGLPPPRSLEHRVP